MTKLSEDDLYDMTRDFFRKSLKESLNEEFEDDGDEIDNRRSAQLRRMPDSDRADQIQAIARDVISDIDRVKQSISSVVEMKEPEYHFLHSSAPQFSQHLRQINEQLEAIVKQLKNRWGLDEY